MSRKIRVIVVDDSALVRSLLSEIINRQRDMECIGTANDPLVAREMIRELNPDVITLDVEMPRMDGIDFLGRLMRLRPMPVVMISTLTERGAEVTMKALELGAIDFVAKPRVGLASGLNDLAAQIVDKIRVAAVAQVRRAPVRDAAPAGGGAAHAPAPASALLGRLSTEKLICIGASTGGTEAIKEVLVQMPADSPAIVITQHMPPGFTTSFAARLNSLCRINVEEARHGQRIKLGTGLGVHRPDQPKARHDPRRIAAAVPRQPVGLTCCQKGWHSDRRDQPSPCSCPATNCVSNCMNCACAAKGKGAKISACTAVTAACMPCKACKPSTTPG